MVIVLYVIALAMIVGGAAAATQGYGIIVNERGWTMVIAGTVAAAGGLLLFGLAIAVAQLRRIEDELARLRDRAGRLDSGVPAPLPPLPTGLPGPSGGKLPEAPRPAPAAEPPGPDNEPEERAVMRAADSIPEPGPFDVPSPRGEPGPVPAAKPAPSIVGTYNSGGNAYVMYSDGSIEAETPTGRYRFESLDELKHFIAAGGEEPASAARPS